MIEVYIALGSNLCNPAQQVTIALSQLAAHPQIDLIKSSSLYRTQPWGILDQPDFINAAAKLTTFLSASELLSELLALEHRHERLRKERNGPRTLDCDILLYGQHVINQQNLKVPHPMMHERGFVLTPLAEIAPDLVINGEPIQHWLGRCDCTGIQKVDLLQEEWVS